MIRWRLESDDRQSQLGELRELRRAIEPEAARLAALRRTNGEADELGDAVRQLAASVDRRDSTGFLEADSRFHRGVLRIARNGMVARLGEVIEEALRERTPSNAVRWRRAPEDIQLHHELAEAIAGGADVAAEALMRQLVEANPTQAGHTS